VVVQLKIQGQSLRASILANRISLLRVRLKKAKACRRQGGQGGDKAVARIKERLAALQLKYGKVMHELGAVRPPPAPLGVPPHPMGGGPPDRRGPCRGNKPKPHPGRLRDALSAAWPAGVRRVVVDLRVLHHSRGLTLDELVAFLSCQGCSCSALATPKLLKSLGIDSENLPPQVRLVRGRRLAPAVIEAVAVEAAQDPNQVLLVSCRGPLLKAVHVRNPRVKVMRAKVFEALAKPAATAGVQTPIPQATSPAAAVLPTAAAAEDTEDEEDYDDEEDDLEGEDEFDTLELPVATELGAAPFGFLSSAAQAPADSDDEDSDSDEDEETFEVLSSRFQHRAAVSDTGAAASGGV